MDSLNIGVILLIAMQTAVLVLLVQRRYPAACNYTRHTSPRRDAYPRS